MKHDGGRVKRVYEEDERKTVNRYEILIHEIITRKTTHNKERDEKGGGTNTDSSHPPPTHQAKDEISDTA